MAKNTAAKSSKKVSKKAGSKKSNGNRAMTKSELINAIIERAGAERKTVKLCLETLQEVGHHELKKNHIFAIPGFAKAF